MCACEAVRLCAWCPCIHLTRWTGRQQRWQQQQQQEKEDAPEIWSAAGQYTGSSRILPLHLLLQLQQMLHWCRVHAPPLAPAAAAAAAAALVWGCTRAYKPSHHLLL